MPEETESHFVEYELSISDEVRRRGPLLDFTILTEIVEYVKNIGQGSEKA